MKRLFCTIVSLVLLATLLSATAFAADNGQVENSEAETNQVESPEVVQSENQATEVNLSNEVDQANTAEGNLPILPNQTVQPTDATDTTTTTVATDNTARTVTDGLHVEVYYPADQDTYIPQFTVELWDVPTNKLVSSTTGN